MLRRTTAFQHDPRPNYSSLVYCLTPNDYSVPFSNASLRSPYQDCHVFHFYMTISFELRNTSYGIPLLLYTATDCPHLDNKNPKTSVKKKLNSMV